jgi:hypothetical protein
MFSGPLVATWAGRCTFGNDECPCVVVQFFNVVIPARADMTS